MDWLPEPKSNCWAWFQPLPQGKSQLSSSGPRDAAALPHSARAHAERNKKGLWGHRAFRLAPVSFLGMQGDLALVEELRNKGRVTLGIAFGSRFSPFGGFSSQTRPES